MADSRTLRFLFAFVLILSIGVPAAYARGRDTPGKPPKRDGFDFGGPGAEPTSSSEKDPKPREVDPEITDPVMAEIAQLGRWGSRKSKLAAEALFLRGAEAIPYMVRALKDKSKEAAPVQPGCAWVLGKIGQKEHIPVILSAAASRPNGSQARVFFTAAYGLDGPTTKRWLIGFLTLNRPVFREKAALYLTEKVGPEDKDRILELLESDKAAVRVAGLQLIEPAGVEDATDRLIAALSDISPKVARKAALLLALKGNEETIARLNALAREGDARERAYATLALVETHRAHSKNPFEPATLTELIGRRGMLHPDKLSRSSAAVGLAYGALDSNDASLTGLLDSTVVDVLIDAVGGDHFRDYASMTEFVFAALRRLSGRKFPNNAVAWGQWWQVERGRFRARRPLRTISATDLPRAYVRFEATEADGRSHWAEFVSADGEQREDAFLLSTEVFRALVSTLTDAGIFTVEDRREPRADEHIAVSLGVMNQRKQMVLTPAENEMAFMRLKMRFMSLIDANLWQRYRDKDKTADARTWWEKNGPIMAEAGPDERAKMLQAAIVYSFDDLPDAEAREDALVRLQDMNAQLTKAQMRDLAKALTQTPSFGDLEARGLEWIIEQGDDSVREDLIAAVADRIEPRAQEILANLLEVAGVERLREGFADPRASMRAASARAARGLVQTTEVTELSTEQLTQLFEQLRPGLEVLALDDEPKVAIQALLGLAYLGERDIAPRLEEYYKTGNLAVKLQVADALGRLPSAQGHGLLTLMINEERKEGSGQIRAAVLEAMARSRHPKAIKLLVFYLLNDADPRVNAKAGEVLAEMGTADARFALLDPLVRGEADPMRRARLVDVLGRFEGEAVGPLLLRHLGDKDIRVVAAAALRGAEHDLPEAVPYLISLLRRGQGTERERALQALEMLTSMRFEETGYSLVAERYEKWYESNAAGNPRVWFRAALKRRGYETAALATYVAGQPELTPVPMLIRVLRDSDPVLRRNAARALTQVTRRSFGVVERNTTARDAAKIADRWSHWWETGPAGGGERK